MERQSPGRNAYNKLIAICKYGVLYQPYLVLSESWQGEQELSDAILVFKAPDDPGLPSLKLELCDLHAIDVDKYDGRFAGRRKVYEQLVGGHGALLNLFLALNALFSLLAEAVRSVEVALHVHAAFLHVLWHRSACNEHGYAEAAV